MANPNLENESLITLDKNQYGIVYLERLKDEWGKMPDVRKKLYLRQQGHFEFR